MSKELKMYLDSMYIGSTLFFCDEDHQPEQRRLLESLLDMADEENSLCYGMPYTVSTTLNQHQVRELLSDAGMPPVNVTVIKRRLLPFFGKHTLQIVF